MKEMKKLLIALAELDEDIDFENEENMISDGIIDSFLLTRIIASLDEAFDIRIKTGDIEPENFENVEAILKLVKRYQQQS